MSDEQHTKITPLTLIQERLSWIKTGVGSADERLQSANEVGDILQSHNPLVEEILEVLPRAGSPSTRGALVNALGQLRGSDTERALEEVAFTDPHKNVRDQAWRLAQTVSHDKTKLVSRWVQRVETTLSDGVAGDLTPEHIQRMKDFGSLLRPHVKMLKQLQSLSHIRNDHQKALKSVLTAVREKVHKPELV